MVAAAQSIAAHAPMESSAAGRRRINAAISLASQKPASCWALSVARSAIPAKEFLTAAPVLERNHAVGVGSLTNAAVNRLRAPPKERTVAAFLMVVAGASIAALVKPGKLAARGSMPISACASRAPVKISWPIAERSRTAAEAR